MTSRTSPERFTLEFYAEPETGREPVVEWMRELDPYLRRAVGVALREVLARFGKYVADTEWGKALGEGLFEFRIRRNAEETIEMYGRRARPERDRQKVLLRIFFYPHGERLVLLLSGYDKGEDPSERRQEKEIALARKRLREYRQRAQG